MYKFHHSSLLYVLCRAKIYTHDLYDDCRDEISALVMKIGRSLIMQSSMFFMHYCVAFVFIDVSLIII